MHSQLTKTLHLSILLISISAPSAELVFKYRGQTTSILSQAEMEKLGAAQFVRVFEGHEKREREYQGYLFNDLLQAAYGEAWKGAEDLLFTCSDGYQPVLPIAHFRKWKSYLAFAAKDGKFSLVNQAQNSEPVDLAPFYLIWENLKDKSVQSEGLGLWPYQVVSVELTSFKDRYPLAAPPKGASETERKGFAAFRQNCMACHTVNGEGGAKAPELNYPANITEYLKEGWLEKWILSPASIRFNTNMPGLPTDDVNRVQRARDIIAYLKKMAQTKRSPKPSGK